MCIVCNARAYINFSRSQNAHARGYNRHASALGETLRPDPRSFLSPRFSVPRHPRVAQARTAFRISEGWATRTREGATARGSVAAGVGALGGEYRGRDKRSTGYEWIAERKVANSAYAQKIDSRYTTGYAGTAGLLLGQRRGTGVESRVFRS